MNRWKPKNIMIRLIRLYQKYISPMKRTKCPYIPTCSQYGLEAIEKYGALKGRASCSVENFALQSFFTWWIRPCTIKGAVKCSFYNDRFIR